MLNMSEVINSLKYEHEYNHFLKIFTELYDVDESSFFLSGGRVECCMIYNQ